MNPSQQAAYLRTQLIGNAGINALINGLIAYFSYRSRARISLPEVAVDAQITIAIIGFLIAWLAVLTARKNQPSVQPRAVRLAGFPLPAQAGWRALLIMLVLMILLGGLVAILSALLAPQGVPGGWYIAAKALYAGTCALLAAWIAIASVFKEAASA